jgi:hypothetical protein
MQGSTGKQGIRTHVTGPGSRGPGCVTETSRGGGNARELALMTTRYTWRRAAPRVAAQDLAGRGAR